MIVRCTGDTNVTPGKGKQRNKVAEIGLRPAGAEGIPKRKEKDMSLTLEEQETHVNFMRGGDRAIIYTSDTTTMTKLNKLVELDGTEWKLESESKLASGELIGKTYSCPVSFITFRSKRVKRNYTDEQRREAAARLHKSTRDNNFSV